MKFARRGFTLIELLIVVIIIGVMAFVVGPSVTTGSDYARLKAASRGVVQLSRYSRTMALLRQVPVELVYSSDGKLRVEPAASTGEKLVAADAFVRTNLLEEAEEIATPALRGESETQRAGGSSYQMADLELEREYKQISFRFEGYTDTMDGGGSQRLSSSWSLDFPEDDEESASFRVHYRSNGTCRPHRVRILAGGDDLEFMVVDVNMLGVARVLREDEL
jgi:prepilin-type N-terminal cleavage/methylation domain-containing protein